MPFSSQPLLYSTHDFPRAPSTPLGVRSRQTPVLDLSEVFANTADYAYPREGSLSSESPLDWSPTDPIGTSVKVEEYLDLVEHGSPATDLSFDIAFEDDLIPYQTRKQAVLGPEDGFDRYSLSPRPHSSKGRDTASHALDDLDLVAAGPMDYKPSLLLDGHFVPTFSRINLSTSPLKSEQPVRPPAETAPPRAVLGDFAEPSSPLALAGLGLGLTSYAGGAAFVAEEDEGSDAEMEGSHASSMTNASPQLLRTPFIDQQQFGMESYPTYTRTYPSPPQYKCAGNTAPEHSYGPYPVVIKPPSSSGEGSTSFTSPTFHQPASFPHQDRDRQMQRERRQRERRQRETLSTEHGTPSVEGKRKLGGANARVGDDKERQRIFHACDACRKRKAKCDAGDPCGRCIMKKVDCHYSDVRNMRGQNKHKKPPGSRKDAAAVRAAGNKFARTAPTVTAYISTSQSGPSRPRLYRPGEGDIAQQPVAVPSFSSSQGQTATESHEDEDSWSDSEGMSARNQPQWTTTVKTEVYDSVYEQPLHSAGMEVEVANTDVQGGFASPQQQVWAPQRPLSKSDPVKPSNLPLASPMPRQDSWSSYPPTGWPTQDGLASPPMDGMGPRPIPLTAPAQTTFQATSYFDMQHTSTQYQGFGSGHVYTDGTYSNLQRFGLAPAAPGYAQHGYYRASIGGMPSQYQNYMSPNPTSYQSTPLQGVQSITAESPASEHPPTIGMGMSGISYSTTSHVRAMSMSGAVGLALRGNGASTLSPPHPRISSNGSGDSWQDAVSYPRQNASASYGESSQAQASTSYAPTPSSEHIGSSTLRSRSTFAAELNGTPISGTPDPAAAAAASAGAGPVWTTQNQEYFNTGTPTTDASWVV